MSTSTPSMLAASQGRKLLHSVTAGNDKLYGYLPGYEQCCFTGSPKKEVVASFNELLTNECLVLSKQGKMTSTPVSKITGLVDRFLTAYYRRMANCRNSAKCAELAELSKKDSVSLSNLLSAIMTGATREIGTIAICPVKSGQVAGIIDICNDKCPYYLNHKFCILYDFIDTEDGDTDYRFINFHLSEYKYLAHAMVTLSSHLVRVDGISVNDLISYHMLFEFLITMGKIFELMNPAGEVRQKYLDDAEEMLTSEPLNVYDENYQHYDSILHEVFEDIKAGKKSYIRDMRDAIDKCGEFLHSKFDPKFDYYTSLKGTAQSKYTGIKESLISSCLEVDVNKDNYSEYDEHIGYISYYPSRDPEFQGEIPTTRTILINNPGKFKPRIIHIGDNPTQDRCAYIHRRLKRLLHFLPEDSTEHQERGRSFLKRQTAEWFLEQDKLQKRGIYCFDFSNATDTLDQHFQHEVLEFIFDPIVANFWDKVSQNDKYIQVVNGGYKLYHQTCGQPQGLLGSFDAFALAHHFIFLMDMKLLGLEEHSAREFYSILGDDSVCTSIVPEYEYFLPDNRQVDSEGIQRSEIELVHFGICESFAGFKVNYDKSDSTHWDSGEAKLDFAKVTYRNGSLFTPIPFRLAMNYSSGQDAKLAVAIWRGDRHDPYAKDYMDLILESCDPIVRDIVKSGTIPYLDQFKDESIKYNSSWLARLRYATAVTHLSMALSFSIVNDRKRDVASFDIFEETMRLMFRRKVRNQINNVDPNHKIFMIMEENAEIIQLMHNIYDQDSLDDKYLTLACSTLGEEFLQGDLFDCLYDLGTVRKTLILAKTNPEIDLSQVFPDFNMEMSRKLVQFSEKLMTRGIAKRPREKVSVLKGEISILSQLDDILGIVPRISS